MKRLLMLQGGEALREVAGILEAQGLSIESVADREQLEARCEAQPPEVVLLDYGTPDLEPIDLCRRWKLSRPLYYPALVFVADELEPHLVVDGLRTGANLVLTPPFRPETLVPAIRAELQRFDGVQLPLEHAFRIHEKVDYLAATNRFLDLILHTTEAPADALEDLRLCMGELGMNAIVHGNRGDSSKKVDVQYRIEPKRVEVTIADEGHGFKPEQLPDPTSPERLLLPSGRGIFLVRQFTDELRFNERGNEVQFVKRLG